MTEHIRLEMDFYGTGQASVSIASERSGERLKEAHLVLLSAFALRQLHNLGRIEPTNQLALNLSSVSNRIVLLSSGAADYGVELIEKRLKVGERRFVATLKYDAEVALLHLDTPGFGILGLDVNYYAPTSVLVLIQHLALAHKGDQSFLSALSGCARMCAVAYQLDKITTPNQPSLARVIANEARMAEGFARPTDPEVEPPPRSAATPTAATPRAMSASNTFCQSCGLPAPTRAVHFYQNIGLLIMRRYSEVKGDLCKSCIDRHFWNMTGKTMLFGWWGLISLIVAPLMILNNTLRWLGSLGMQRPPIQTSKGPSPIWVFSTIGGFLIIGYFVYTVLTASSTASRSQSTSQPIAQESCAVAVIGFTANLR